MPLPARLAVLLSGRGSNFEALADACVDGRIPGQIVAVVSDRTGARGLARATERGLPVHELPFSRFGSREAHEAAVEEVLSSASVDVVCLAGYMRVLSPEFVSRRRLRILNVHPSLLPAFPGLAAQKQAIEWGTRVTGVTVHFVDAGVDTGPVVDQVGVRVREDDDAAVLAARILPEEHRLYVAAVSRILRGGWMLEGRRIVGPVP